jgi:polyribonucleotide nucleotidyltransferase
MSKIIRVKSEWGGVKLELEKGLLAEQADGAVLVTFGETKVLCTAVLAKKVIVEDQDFTDLTINYLERFYAAGRIPGGFLKREGRGSDKEVLLARLIDRSLRPLVKLAKDEALQVFCTLLSFDGENLPEVPALLGATTAIKLAGISCKTLVGAKLTLVEKSWIINPGFSIQTRGEIFASGTKEAITMIESNLYELSKKEVMLGLDKLQKAFITPIKLIEELLEKSKIEERILPEINQDDQRDLILKTASYQLLEKALDQSDKKTRNKALQDAEAALCLELKMPLSSLNKALKTIKNDLVAEKLLLKRKRLDGRAYNEIRDISCQVKLLPRAHGSALFTRGETQVLGIVTLGGKNEGQLIEDITGTKSDPFILHYNFHPFSVGEIGGAKGISRREIGHGTLAKKALIPVLGPYSYTIRAVSEILSCNGSSSMGTICAISLALQEAGVAIKRPVAGIAMGLIQAKEETLIISDIMGEEDHLGGLDFKLAGTSEGITAIQMDTKTEGLDLPLLSKVLEQGLRGINYILARMQGVLDKESPKEPQGMLQMTIEKEQIGTLIGPKGKTIKDLAASNNCKIDLDDEGKVTIHTGAPKDLENARDKILALFLTFNQGEYYSVTVNKVADFGLFVELPGGSEGFIHVSDLSDDYLEKIGDKFKVGDKLKARMIGFDRNKKIKLSLKAEKIEKNEKPIPDIETPTLIPHLIKKKRFF